MASSGNNIIMGSSGTDFSGYVSEEKFLLENKVRLQVSMINDQNNLEVLASLKKDLLNARAVRHKKVTMLAFKEPPPPKLIRGEPSAIPLVTAPSRFYAKEEYMFSKYIKERKEIVKAEEHASREKENLIETAAREASLATSIISQGLKADLAVDSFHDDNFDALDFFDESDEKAFPTIKDVAEFEARKTEELWKKVESENVDFTNYPEYDEAPVQKNDGATCEESDVEMNEQDACERFARHQQRNSNENAKRKSNKVSKTVVVVDRKFPPSWTDDDAKLLTKKGTVRVRRVRKDTKRFLPSINPILPVEGQERKRPLTLQDYLVVKSVAAKRFKFEGGRLSPKEKFLLKQAYLDDNDDDVNTEEDAGNGPLSRHVYGCMYCNFMGAKKNWLKHLRNKHRNVESLVFCTYTKFCNMPFDTTEDLDAHIGLVHGTHDQTGPRSTAVSLYPRTDVKPDPDPDDSPKKFSPTKTSGLFYCMFCDYSHSKRNWVHHLKTKHKDRTMFHCTSNKQCNLIFDTREKLDAHVTAMHECHKCGTCGQEFIHATVLQEHRKIHNLARDRNGDSDSNSDSCFVCTFCGKRYRTRKGCREHEALRHDQRKLRHLCDFVHPPENGGSQCQSAFYSSKELVIHKRKHTGELPFICGYCGNRYISKATLVQHERTRHLETENVECEICHKRLKRRNLAFHVRRHKGFVSVPCKFCGKTFSSIGARNRHEKIHTQDKQYECSYCGKAFVQKSNLQSHERIHTGERPYTCKHCGEGFMQHTRRNVHQQSCRAQSSNVVMTSSFSGHQQVHTSQLATLPHDLI